MSDISPEMFGIDIKTIRRMLKYNPVMSGVIIAVENVGHWILVGANSDDVHRSAGKFHLFHDDGEGLQFFFIETVKSMRLAEIMSKIHLMNTEKGWPGILRYLENREGKYQPHLAA